MRAITTGTKQEDIRGPLALPGIVLLLAAALSGCAAAPTTALLTYQTVPDAAELFEAGQSLGLAPVTRTYHSDGKSSTIETPDVKAVWPSGAATSFYTVLPVGEDRVATLERPANAPGLQADLDHAKTVAAARQKDAERIKAEQLRDLARASARCKQEQSQGGKGLTDDCR
jgi:hypothetical protein